MARACRELHGPRECGPRECEPHEAGLREREPRGLRECEPREAGM
jgi:hypothetical protein